MQFPLLFKFLYLLRPKSVFPAKRAIPSPFGGRNGAFRVGKMDGLSRYKFFKEDRMAIPRIVRQQAELLLAGGISLRTTTQGQPISRHEAHFYFSCFYPEGEGKGREQRISWKISIRA
jgi:hypothetical protein